MKTRTFAKRACQKLIGTLAMVASCSVLAAPVLQWGFEVNSGFTAYNGTGGGLHGGVVGSLNNVFLGTPAGGSLTAPSLLTWGTSTGSGSSSLGVGATTSGNFTGSLNTNGAAVNTVEVIHTNNPVTGNTLSTATLYDLIKLTPLVPAGSPFFPPALAFNIHFLETPNEAGTCVVTSLTPCNDIFVLDVAGAGFNPADNSLNQTFFYGTDAYNAILHINGLGLLTNAACGAVGVANGCIGFTTVENQQNRFQVSLAISDKPFVVPEPSSLALFGLAFAGLGLIGRRKLSAS